MPLTNDFDIGSDAELRPALKQAFQC